MRLKKFIIRCIFHVKLRVRFSRYHNAEQVYTIEARRFTFNFPTVYYATIDATSSIEAEKVLVNTVFNILIRKQLERITRLFQK